MGDAQGGPERLLKQVVSGFRCRVCRQGFDQEHVHVTARHEQIWLISARCTRCRNQQVFWLGLRSSAETCPRDLTEEEEQRFAALAPVAADDVLAVHEFLDGFNGDFKVLFSRL